MLMNDTWCQMKEVPAKGLDWTGGFLNFGATLRLG